MASLLDISLLSQFGDIFVILFIFTAAYAILMVKAPFGSNKGLNAMMAFAISMMFIFSKDAIAIVRDTVPWFILMMVILMLTLLATNSIGAVIPESLMVNIGTWIFVIGVIIFIINVSLRLGQDAGPFLGNNVTDPDNVIAGGEGDVGSGSFSQNFSATLFHPKVLAMILVLVVALFAVYLVGFWL